MEAVFLRVLNMSISAAAVIAAVLLVRLALRRAPKKWRYLLWVAPAFRLGCPVSFRAFFSVFRLLPSAAASAPAAGVGNLNNVSGMTYVSRPVVYSPVSSVPGAQLPIPSGVPVVQVTAQAAAVPASVDPVQIWLAIGAALWLTGLAVMLIVGVVRYLRMKGKLADAVLLERGVYATDAIRVPFVLGLLRPRVYVPAGLAGKELDYVLAHERAHLRRGDHWVKLLSYLLLSLHWFNPLVWLAFYLMSRDMEMSCDERVLSAMEGEAGDYSRTLLGFAVGRRFPAPAPLAFGESDVKSRIKNALNWRKPRLWVTLLAVILCFAAIAACTANPSEKTEETGTPWDWSHSLKASDIREAKLKNASARQEIALTKAQVEEVTALLNAVPREKVLQGRGIPSEKVLYLQDTGYALRFAGGIIELDTPVPNADTEEGPVVWEIHDDALYAWLDALWSETMDQSEPGDTLDVPLAPVDTSGDTVRFAYGDGAAAFESTGSGKTNADLLDALPFAGLDYLPEENFLSLEGPVLPAYGSLRIGMSREEVYAALYGSPLPEESLETLLPRLTAPRLTLHDYEEGSGYPVSGVYASLPFDLSLGYDSYANHDLDELSTVLLRFLPNGGMEHAADMFSLLRSALTAQLGSADQEWALSEAKALNPGSSVGSMWFLDTSTAVLLTLEVDNDGYRSLTVMLCRYAELEEDHNLRQSLMGLDPYASQVTCYGGTAPTAASVAVALYNASIHPAIEPPEEKQQFFWTLQAYLTVNVDNFKTNAVRYVLDAGLAEDMVRVRWPAGKGDEWVSVWLEDHELYTLLRDCYRQEGIVEADAWEKYGAALEARAQSTVVSYKPYGAMGFTGFEITRLEKTAHVWRSPEGEYLPVYAWDVAFTPEEVTNVGLAGSMDVDAEFRVTGYEHDTFFAVREGPGGPELTFLGYDEFFSAPEASYPVWREAYWKLLDEIVLRETEYNDWTGPVQDLGLADLSGDGVPELICYLPGGGMSASAVIVTFEEGEARAFNADCTYGLPLAKNAAEGAWCADPEPRYPSDGAFRYDPEQGWVLTSANGTELDTWSTWYRFGTDRNGYLACEQLIGLYLCREESEGGNREIDWEVNGVSVVPEDYHAVASAYETWNKNLDAHPEFTRGRISFFDLRDRAEGTRDRLAAWLGVEP